MKILIIWRSCNQILSITYCCGERYDSVLSTLDLYGSAYPFTEIEILRNFYVLCFSVGG